ncbi:MAG TPA: type II toxin-antitoxin system prevent-host-death family antitoxin [Ferruginibacter sp.]|nr:type II toxin-antitoxin system prevent-host-death family antitoxin [Ferruginibacter sp.]
MEVLNYTEFRKKMKESLDSVSDDNNIVIVSRSKNKNVVLLSMDEYNSWNETMHLIKSDKNRKRLDEAITEMKKGKSVKKSLLEK